MKKYILLLFIFCLQLLPAKAQWVTIPDFFLRVHLTQEIPTCMNGNQLDTTCPEIANLTSLILTGVYDLTGIEYLTHLETLDCGTNSLISIPQLPNSLLNLQCYMCSLSSLPALPNSLQTLNCQGNVLTSLPTLPSSLKTLICSDNFLNSLPLLPDSLITLYCQNNQLSNLPALPNSIQSINCNANQLTSLPTLPDSLHTLYCNNNQISYIQSFPNSLKILQCGGNQLYSLPSVPSGVTSYYIQSNNISCLDNLPDSANGNIQGNPLTCVPKHTNYSTSYPLCMDNDSINNPNNCPAVSIMGHVFSDLNNNCTFNNNDQPSENLRMKLFDTQNNLLEQSYTMNGIYSFSTIVPDTYQVKIDINAQPIIMACLQPFSQNVILNNLYQTISNINFPVLCDTINDLFVNSIVPQGIVFPGQIHRIYTKILSNNALYNLYCSSSIYSGEVSIQVTGPVTYISPAPNSLLPIVNGNTFTYNITDFSTLTPQSFGLQFLTDTTAQANDQICVHVEINPTPIDADTSNNVYDFCYQVFNSYDPNMKEVYPVNVLPGYDDWFTYTIHFQNTGSAPAFNIRLRDTLDANLDINTFEIRGYSHPAIVSINGNVLTVRFNNIMLPDSTTDYEGSMGYFQYRIKPLANLPLGTQIENTAYIYFDYNAPIITNTTQNNFQTVVSTINKNDDANQLKVFPNPVNEVLNINLQNNNIENCIITNALGQTVYISANEIKANHKIQLNIADLSAGVYFVKVSSASGSYNGKFIKS